MRSAGDLSRENHRWLGGIDALVNGFPSRVNASCRSTTKRGIEMDEFPDVTDWREPDVPSYESSGPFDDYEEF